MLQLSADELQSIRNAAQDKQIFLVVDESVLSDIQYLNVLVGSIETPQVSGLCDGQAQPCVPNMNSIAEAVDDDVRSF